MKKISILLVLLLFVVFCSFAQGNSMLWKISGNGLKQDSYLFGTIHMLCPDDFVIKQKNLDAFNSSKKIIFEVDLSKPENAKSLQAFAVSDPNFIKGFSEDEIKKMDSVLVAQQLSIKLLDYVSPVAVISLFSMKGFNCPDPTKMKSYEVELAALANSHGKTIGEFETPDFQFNLLKDLITPKLFMESVFQLDKYPALTAKMVEAYKSENLEELTKLLEDSAWMTAEQKDKLLIGRNLNWSNLIPEVIKDQSCFIAVGAGHLAGNKGLITLLRDKGFTVEAVK
ncbi:TraB/GumN family protein [Sphingobacterium sp. UBA5670]|uniref:TraB/GumN family protein n=1 Tax=Sphingobacterium sp. UBA5670 TaxID=1947502 RepID=UPI0025EF6CC9|nr:TraB/GumN family protein [Sphingobacterium sp. UBA5670]